MVFALVPFTASAYDFQSDGIYYNITSSDDKTVEVTGNTSLLNSYSGSVTIPSTVTYSGITYTVTAIGEYAFYFSSDLTDVSIPVSVTSIGDYALGQCVNLTTVNIPNSVTSLGNCTFAGSANLSNVIIPNSITSIGESVFSYTSLTNVTIPGTVTSIGDYAFSMCSKLKSISLPASLTSIGNEAFYASGLPTVTIPNSVTSIGNMAFASSAITSITIPSSVTSIGFGPFAMCAKLQNIETASDNKNYVSVDGVLFTKDMKNLIQYPVAKTNSTYSIPSTVTVIGTNAFTDSRNLINIDFPEGLTTIGEYAFSACSGLTSIDIPNSVTSIERSAFSWCLGLTSVVIGNSVSEIKDYAFSSAALQNVYCYPTTPPTIYNDTFNGCFSATLHVPTGCTDDYKSAEYWKEFSEINDDFSSKTYDFKSDGIYYKITDSVDKTVEVTYKGTYYNSYSGAVTIPSTVSYSGTAYSVTAIGEHAFAQCADLTSVTIPNSVNSIGENAFFFCRKLTSLTIPNSVTTIEPYAFSYCNGLTSLIIPNSVTTIGDKAFSYCIGLENIYINATTPPTIYNFTFESCYSATLHVPQDCADKYKSSEYWNFFSDIIDDLSVEDGVDEIIYREAEVDWSNAEYYDLQGSRVINLTTGIYIQRVGNHIRKIFIK